MKDIFTRKSLLNRSLVIHPFLFAVFAILFLYAHNISETTANQIFTPILFSTLATFLLWLLLSFLLKDKIKAGLATTLFVFLFFSYGRFYELLERWDVFVPKHGVLLPAVLLLWGYCVYFIKKARWDFKDTTKLLNLVAIVLILVNLFTIVHHEIGSPGITSAQGDTENTGAQEPNSDQGNINVAISQETMGAYETYDYIINGSFEEGDPPDDWAPNNIASRSSEQVRLGSYSAKLQGNGTDPAELFQYIPFDDYFKGRKFTLGLWYWLPPDNTVNSFVSIYDGVGETSSDVLTRGGAWHRVTVTRTFDAAATTFRIALKLYTPDQFSTRDYGYFDGAICVESDIREPEDKETGIADPAKLNTTLDIDYIINGSFEEGDPPDDWAPNNIASRSSEQVRLGSYSAKLQGNGTDPAELFQYIPFDDYFKGRKFTLDLWYWLPPDNTVNSFVSIYDGVGETSSDVLTRDGAWHRVTVTRTFDAAATTFRIALKLYIGSYRGQSSKIDYGYFDDAMLFEGDTINNIINGSFEEGDPPDDWTPNGNVIASRSSEQVRLGSYSVKLQGNGTDPAELFQYIPFDDYSKGKKFTLSVSYWLPPDNVLDSFVSIYDGVGETSSDVLTRDGAWHRVTVTRTFDAAATTFRIALKLYTPDQSSTRDYGYFDDAICVESDIREPEEKATEIADPAKLNTTPDIYYIILDEYAHPDTMKEFYDYDNSDFVNNLVDKGFFVAHESKTSSAHTERSIASSLNMDDVSSTREDEAVYQKIAKNKVVDFLKSHGYKYIHFGSPLEYGRYEVDADLYYNFYQEGNSTKISEFQHILWNTTMLLPFYDSATSSQFESYFRCGLIETLDYLREVPKMEGPKFVFAHIYCPHWPFVFGPNGEVIPPQDWRNYQDKEFYLGQYIFITKQVEGVIDAILKNSSRPPIIIIQSDHGLRPSLWGTFAEFQKYGGEEWRKIFNAYYLPGTGTEGLYDSISPVNSFRLVFNLYFGTSYKFLKD